MKLAAHRGLLAGIGACGVVTLVGLFLSFRTYQAVAAARERVAALRRDIRDARAKKGRIPRLEREVIILRANVEEYVKVLPDEKDIHEFVNTINRFEEECGVRLTALDAPPPAQRPRKRAAFDRIVYKLRFTGPFRGILAFLNRCENFDRFVAIDDVSLRPAPGEAKGGAEREVPLNAVVTLETFVYHPAGSGRKPVTIPDLERKRAALREEILARRTGVEVRRYRLDPAALHGRRDPFADPRRPVAREDRPGGGESLQKQKAFVAWARGEWRRIQALLAAEKKEPLLIRQMELRREIDGKLARLHERLRRATREKWLTVRPLREALEREVAAPLRRLLAARQVALKEGLSRAALKRLAATLERLYRKGDLASLVERYRLAAKRLGATHPRDEEGRRLLARIRDLHRRAVVIQEFGRRPLRIQGIVAVRGRPVAILNGRVYEEGQHVDEEVQILKIRSEEIEFLFRGVRIVRRWD